MMTMDNPTKRRWLPEQALLFRFNYETMCYDGIEDDHRLERAIKLFDSLITFEE